jgi:GT2 family glycosyltransferase
MKLGFVFTNYNNSACTRAAIASLRAANAWHDMRVVVVDNRSDPADAARLREIGEGHPEIALVFNPENVGYFPGLNIGIRRLRSLFPDVEHLVVGNNDLEFPTEFIDVVTRLRDHLLSWAVVSPDIVTPDGIHQNPHVFHAITRARKLLWDAYFLSYGAAIGIRLAATLTSRFTAREEKARNGQLHRAAGPIEQGYGACYLIGPLFLERFGALCAPTFLMQEEFFLSEQLKTIGQTMYYDPRIVVYHRGRGATSRLPSRRQWEISRDAHLLYKRYLSMGPDEQRRFISATSR